MQTRFNAVLSRVLARLQLLPPRWQRMIGVGVPCGLVVLLIALVMPSSKPELGIRSQGGYVGQVLVSGNESDNTIDSLTAAVTRMMRESAERDRAIQELRDELHQGKRAAGEAPAAPAPGGAAHDTRGEAQARPAPPPPVAVQPPASPAAPAEKPRAAVEPQVVPPPAVTASAGSPIQMDMTPRSNTPADISAGSNIASVLAPEAVWAAPARRAAPDTVRPVSGAAAPPASVVAAPRLYVYGPPVASATALPPAQPRSRVFELPPGATFGGVLLTGFDAPTAQQARRDPLPALLRIKHETLLPNRYDADQRECFVLLSGYGDLSAERAYLRTEELSCVLADGATFHERIEGYAVDESGRIGVRGPVVSRQGAFIARSLVVGIMQGVAQAFAGSNQSYGLGINGSGQLGLQQYQNMTQSGVIEGAGKGLDRVAEFYLNQAAAMFPVIEINAGRPVDVVLTKAVKVQLPGGS